MHLLFRSSSSLLNRILYFVQWCPSKACLRVGSNPEIFARNRSIGSILNQINTLQHKTKHLHRTSALVEFVPNFTSSPYWPVAGAIWCLFCVRVFTSQVLRSPSHSPSAMAIHMKELAYKALRPYFKHPVGVGLSTVPVYEYDRKLYGLRRVLTVPYQNRTVGSRRPQRHGYGTLDGRYTGITVCTENIIYNIKTNTFFGNIPDRKSCKLQYYCPEISRVASQSRRRHCFELV